MVTSSQIFRDRIFLEFDISEGPETATDVYLQVYLKGFNNGNVTLTRLIEEFPDPITWNNSPFATSVNGISLSLPTGEEYEWYSFDVTNLYNDAKAQGMDTLGIRWKYDNENQSDFHQRFIKSKEASGDLGSSISVSFDAPPTLCYIRGHTWDREDNPVSGASVEIEGSAYLTGADGYTEYVQVTCSTTLATAYVTPPTGYTCYNDKCHRDYFAEEGYDDVNFPLVKTPTPTISSISWTPTGDHVTLAPGTTLTGEGETRPKLKLIATNPAAVVDPIISSGEAILQINQEDPFIVAEGDHFRFDNKEWWALNIICGPECDWITLADEVAEFEKIPKIGDEIKFAAAIDWHDKEMGWIRWYYARAPNKCFDKEDLDWTEFAVGENTNMPAHTFEAEGDEEITFFRVTATTLDGATGEMDTLCGPIFNLWVYQPSWWDQLLEAVREVDEEIAHPIVMLSENISTIPGWTEPPFECPICKQVFNKADSELQYAEHLHSHIKAFVENWFEQ